MTYSYKLSLASHGKYERSQSMMLLLTIPIAWNQLPSFRSHPEGQPCCVTMYSRYEGDSLSSQHQSKSQDVGAAE